MRASTPTREKRACWGPRAFREHLRADLPPATRSARRGPRACGARRNFSVDLYGPSSHPRLGSRRQSCRIPRGVEQAFIFPAAKLLKKSASAAITGCNQLFILGLWTSLACSGGSV